MNQEINKHSVRFEKLAKVIKANQTKFESTDVSNMNDEDRIDFQLTFALEQNELIKQAVEAFEKFYNTKTNGTANN